MGRKRKGYRVLGPYRHFMRWRIILIGPDGKRKLVGFDTEVEARKAIKAHRKQIPGMTSVEELLDKYETAQIKKELKPGTVTTGMFRLRNWLDSTEQIHAFTPKRLQAIYDRRCKAVAADTQRNELRQVKAFFGWVVSAGYLSKSPAEGIEPVGRRRRGKAQLRRHEARTLYLTALESAKEGDAQALAVLLVLTLGIRSSELLARRVRDVDVGPDSVLLWIDEGKTDSAARYFEVPESLSTLLADQAGGRDAQAWLWPSTSDSGHLGPAWLRSAVKSFCKSAKVPAVTPHGLRGTWATLTTDAGVSGQIIAREMGHASQEVTRQHYIEPGAEERARAKKMLRLIDGGRE